MSIDKVSGLRLKFLREQRNENQEGVAALLDASIATVSRYESGERKPDYKTIIKLAEYFNVSTDYLLGVTDIPDIQPSHGDIDAIQKPSVEMFVPANIDLICGRLSYAEMSKDMAIKMNNPLYKTIFNSGYLKTLAKGKIAVTRQTIDLLAAYAKVDPSFFYRKNTIEDLENAKMEYIKNVATGSRIPDDELKTFMLQSDNVDYINFAKALKDLDVNPQKLTLILESFFRNADDWKYIEFAQALKNKGIDPNEIIGYSLKYDK
jgi:transcriptional regulator with XRE-family HTH domain